MDNEYKSVCDKCGIKTWYSGGQKCSNIYFKGCQKCGSHEYISKQTKCNGTLRTIDNSDLSPKLKPYCHTNQRVEITFKDGTKERGTIGKSTGWKPVYLLIKTTRSLGGEALTDSFIQNVRQL